MPYFSTPRWTVTPQIFLPPSKPRSKQLGADLQDLSPDSCPLADSERGLSITTALGSAISPQARCGAVGRAVGATAQAGSIGCASAWKSRPVSGVIGVQNPTTS